MSTKPAVPKSPTAPERYMPGDPIPVPDAVEASSESAWALFNDGQPASDTDFLDTVPASILDEQTAAGTAPSKPVP